MQKMQIEISYQDQVDLENICTEKGWSYSQFFSQLLAGYKKFGFERTVPCGEAQKIAKEIPVESSRSVSVESSVTPEVSEPKSLEETSIPKRRGRPPKVN